MSRYCDYEDEYVSDDECMECSRSCSKRRDMEQTDVRAKEVERLRDSKLAINIRQTLAKSLNLTEDAIDGLLIGLFDGAFKNAQLQFRSCLDDLAKSMAVEYVEYKAKKMLDAEFKKAIDEKVLILSNDKESQSVKIKQIVLNRMKKFFDDLGYRNTSLFSPKLYKELILEAHRLICDYFHNKDIKVFLHSCGCVKELIPYFIEAGIDCLQPLEVKAGMDIIELKKEYGEKLAFMGGIDVRLMSGDNPARIEEEIKTKFEIAKKGGGYIYHSDH